MLRRAMRRNSKGTLAASRSWRIRVVSFSGVGLAAQRRGESTVAKIFSFYPDKKCRLSRPLHALLDKMLKFEPSERIDLAAVARSPWLAPHLAPLDDIMGDAEAEQSREASVSSGAQICGTEAAQAARSVARPRGKREIDHLHTSGRALSAARLKLDTEKPTYSQPLHCRYTPRIATPTVALTTLGPRAR